MAAVIALSTGAHVEHHDLFFWMDRVLNALESVRSSLDRDAVHDLRVAVRRCRSVAAVMEEVDPDPAWPAMRKAARKLFRSLGALRDAQVLNEWVKKLAPESDPLRANLQVAFASREPQLRDAALRVASKFDQKSWKHLARTLRQRICLVPVRSLTAKCLVLERFESAKDLHAKALRTEKPKPWHALRIGLKRFRYTVESLLPEHYAAWSDNLKRLQDMLGEIHDFDVLTNMVNKSDSAETEDLAKPWREAIAHERDDRMQTYRRLTLGQTSLWNIWRAGLPTNRHLKAAAQARLRTTARAVDPHASQTSQISRVAVAVYQTLKRTNAAPAFREAPMQRILLAAARMCGVGDANADGAPQKAARKFLRNLPLPPGWNNEEWELLGTVVRYHRGAEPSAKRGPFSKIRVEQQDRVRGLAGILRLARALRKCGVKSGTDLRGEKAAESVVLWLRGLAHDVETASRLAAGKHLLEEYLGLPLVLKPAAKPGQCVTYASRQAPGLEAPLQDLASPREVHAWVDSQLEISAKAGATNRPTPDQRGADDCHFSRFLP